MIESSGGGERILYRGAYDATNVELLYEAELFGVDVRAVNAYYAFDIGPASWHAVLREHGLCAMGLT